MKILRRINGHRSFDKMQGPDEYMRASCTCGSRFKTRDDHWGIHDFENWEKNHQKPSERSSEA